MELVEGERDRLRTEATTSKAELSVARSDRERAKTELAEAQDLLATLHVEHAFVSPSTRINWRRSTD